MTSIQFTNEKGNVSAKMREHIKASTIAKITEAFEAVGLDAIVNADKGLSIAVATDKADGAVIFVHCDFSVSKRDPMTKTAKSKTKAKTKAPEVELPDLFADVANVETVDESVEG